MTVQDWALAAYTPAAALSTPSLTCLSTEMRFYCAKPRGTLLFTHQPIWAESKMEGIFHR